MKILRAGQAFYQQNNGQAVFTINLAGLAAPSSKTKRSGRVLGWHED